MYCKYPYIIIKFISLLTVLGIGVSGCKGLIEVPEPINTITTSEAFKTDTRATSALLQIYSSLANGNGNISIGNGITTLYAGLSADELKYFGSDPKVLQFQSNTLQSDNSIVYNSIWVPAFQNIYYANAVIEGVQASATVSPKVKSQLVGEAKFLRAFINFYLVNFFGDIPLVTATDWTKISLLPRTSKDNLYRQIIEDLKDAENLLPEDYMISNGERTRANRGAAEALLARVYLYREEWANAEVEVLKVLNNVTAYEMETTLGNVFMKNSREAILQLEVNNKVYPYTVREANQLIPPDNNSSPNYYLSSGLLEAFESGDERRNTWVNSVVYMDSTYFYPYKYTVYQGEANGGIPQYYVLMRLAELYLIRAEARAHVGNLIGAIDDINIIRSRAGLQNLMGTLTQEQVFAAVAKERRVELFAEWGHRWFDLKRTDRTTAVLAPLKPGWRKDAQLYPIPLSEMQTDPNLTQNEGY